jgi:hypothetical protein
MRKIKRKRKVGLVRQRRKNSKLEVRNSKQAGRKFARIRETMSFELRVFTPRDSLSAAPHDDFKHSLPR